MKISTRHYSLAIKHNKTNTRITMSMTSQLVTTKQIPKTSTILRKRLPEVFKTDCYNDKKLPFKTEVKNTEVGHLFEHIMLQYMFDVASAREHNKSVFKGETSWNWKKDPEGTFHIRLNVGAKDRVILKPALNKTKRLMSTILNSV